MNVLIDTDPGGDDAIALMWLASLAHQGRIRLAGVTTTAGNVSADKTFTNACRLLALCGLCDVPVGRGEDKGRRQDAAHIHGHDGLGGLASTLPAAAAEPASVRDSSQMIRHALSPLAKPLRLLAVGPLGNLADAERRVPGTLARATQVVVMGGALGTGNVTRRAEFNFFFDPEAAALVLGCGASIRLITLDTSLNITLNRRAAAAVAEGLQESPPARFFQALCRFMRRREASRSGNCDAFPVHDAATVAWTAYPELFTARMRRLVVRTSGEAERGRLMAGADAVCSCATACHVDVDTLMQHLVRDLRWLMTRLSHGDGIQTPR